MLKRLLATFSLMAAVSPAGAQIIPLGSPLQMVLTNVAGCADQTCTYNTIFNGTAQLNADLSLTTSQVATSGGGEWDIFKLTGNPSVGADPNSLWQIQMRYGTSQDYVFDGVESQWTTDGAPTSPISNFQSICCATNSPSILAAPAYANMGFKTKFTKDEFAPPSGTLWNEVFANPYSVIGQGGNPVGATDYDFALHFDPAGNTPMVPEASTWAMMLIGFGLMALGGRRVRQRLADY
jgi:hypothetical protein